MDFESISTSRSASVSDLQRQTSCSSGSGVYSVSIGRSSKTSFGGTHYSITTLNNQLETSLYDTATSTLDQHQKEVHFVQTQGYKAAIQKLLTYGKVVLTSGYKDGKTTIGNELLLHFSRENEGFVKKSPVIIRFPQHWHALVSPKENVIILLDDIFGRYTAEKEVLRIWELVFPDIYTCINDEALSVYVIITIRDHVLRKIKDRLKEYALFEELDNFLVDLSDNQNLTDQDKRLILTKYLSKSRLQNSSLLESEIEEVLKICTPHAFPSCCEKYANNLLFNQQGLIVFRKPVSLLLPDVDFLCEVDEIILFLFALILFSECKSLTFDFLNSSSSDSYIHTIASSCMTSLPYNYLNRLQHKMKQLDGIFLLITDESVCFINDVIKEVAIHVISKWDIFLLINDLDFPLLMSSITLTDEPTCKLNIERRHTFALIERITRELKKGFLNDILESDVMKDIQFIKMLIDELMSSGNINYFIGKGRSSDSIFMMELDKKNPNFKLLQQIIEKYPKHQWCCMIMQPKKTFPRWFQNMLNNAMIYVSQKHDLPAFESLTDSVDEIPCKILYAAANNDESIFDFLLSNYEWRDNDKRTAFGIVKTSVNIIDLSQ